MSPAVAIAWIVLGLPSMVLVTFVAGRLLGARRGWLALMISGVVGWLVGLLLAGQLTAWNWSSLNMVLATLALGTVLTMALALGIDFLNPPGTLASGAEAGLFTFENPLASWRQRRAKIARFREILHLARVNGLVGRHIAHDELPDEVRHTLEQAGGIFVKLGQVASTRSDVLPEAWTTELALLRSKAEPEPVDQIRPLIEGDLDGSIEELFGTFDWDPMASASIAQVYRATLHDATPVVVKVQRPGLDEKLVVDSAAVLQIAALIERRTPLGLTVRPVDLASEFLDNVAEELDFRIEAANARELAQLFSDTSGIRVPATYPERSSSRVLTEEQILGVSVADVDALRAAGVDPIEVADRIIRSFLTQIFDAGLFHADPHPGNILVEEDGTIVFIDLGAVGRMSPSQRSATLDLLVAASSGNSVALRHVLTEIVPVADSADLRALDRAIDQLLARHMRAGGGLTAAALQDLAVVTGSYGLRLPDWMATLIRTMVTLEGTLLGIDPDFSLVEAVQHHASGVPGLGGPDGIRGGIEQLALTELPRLRRMPARIDDLLGQASEGRLSARLSLFSDEHNERVVTKLVNRIALSLLAAAIGVGSILLLGVGHGPSLGTSTSINEVLGYIGLASASVLSMRVIAGIIRDGGTT